MIYKSGICYAGCVTWEVRVERNGNTNNGKVRNDDCFRRE